MKTFMITIWIMLLTITHGLETKAQTDTSIGSVINIYARVTGFNECPNSLTVDTADGFAIGDRVLIIQMKGATANTTSGSTYGNITATGNAGHYDFNEILAVSGNNITLKYLLQRSYDIPGMVQIVRVPVFTQTVNITSTLTCRPWNINTGKGGVLVFEAPGSQVNLMADINVDGLGFAGGMVSNDGTNGCVNGYFYAGTTTDGGFKGESFVLTPAGHECGRGKLAGGGGGGNDLNAGGGGGGGAAVLGDGGLGGTTFGTNCGANGVGGLAVSAFSDGYIFLGSGGGGGHQDNTSAGNGGNGGGIIMITAATINIPGTVSHAISANGNDGMASTSPVGFPSLGDGAGGGGGAGTVYLQCGSFTSTLSGGLNGKLAINAHGGNGGDVTSGSVHGPGGGGGGGKTYFFPSPASWGPVNVIDNSGGNPGIWLGDTTSHQATAGHYGHFRNNIAFNNDSVLFQPLTAKVNGVDSIVICAGDSLVFTLMGIDSSTTYVWNGPGISPQTGYSFVINGATAANSGYFIVDNDLCLDSVYVQVKNCCKLVDSGSGYVTYDASAGPITASQALGDKVYITGGILSVQGANVILDVTNADIVFDECSGMKITGGAIMRANNSVFRPCNMDLAWAGVEIETEGNIIDECVFKNAVTGINLTEEGTAKIHNSLFLNNNTGVSINGIYDYPYAISGNRFVVDKDAPSYIACGGQDGTFTGLASTNASHDENISQNFFINHNVDELNNYRGIFFNSSFANITSNTFTNMWRAIDIVQNTGRCNVENNRIEINDKITATTLYQVNVTNGTAPVLLFNNSITDPNDYIANTVTNAAVYCDNQEFLYIKNNNIIGFETGIELYNTNNSMVTENHILNSAIGIYNQGCTNLHMECNEIDLDFETLGGVTKLCIGIYSQDIDVTSRIHSNCILDAKRAMEFQSASPVNNVLPAIRNNFMYNYLDQGILVNGYGGTIGTVGIRGLNTFYSNSNAWDLNVSAGFVVTTVSNYGPVVVTSNVLTSLTSDHSTTSCGRQTLPFGSMQHYLDAEIVCDDYDLVIEPMYMEESEMMLAPDGGEAKGDVYTAINAINAVSGNRQAGEIDRVYSTYSKLPSLSGNEKAMVDYIYHKAIRNHTKAYNILDNFEPVNNDEQLWLLTEKINLDAATGKTISKAELENIQSLFSVSDKYINRVRGILIPNMMEQDLHFNKKQISAREYGKPALRPLIDDLFEIYPNPAQDELSVRFSLADGGIHQLVVTDVVGKVITSREFNFDAGTLNLDISHLSNGTYFVYIPNISGKVQVARFVKN